MSESKLAGLCRAFKEAHGTKLARDPEKEMRYREDFKAMVCAALEEDYTVDSFASEMRVSRPTVRRWAAGDTFPHPIAGHAVANVLSRGVS